MTDDEVAVKIKEECSSNDLEMNGCNLDAIMHELLLSLGYTKSAAEFEDVDCWRA